MAAIQISPLDWANTDQVGALRQLVVDVFNDPVQYGESRIGTEIQAAAAPLEKAFFLAYSHGQLVGAGGVKSADWASGVWILYLSAVANHARGRGIGKDLIKARIHWVKQQARQGKILVSTGKPKRYRDLGFDEVGKQGSGGKHLMALSF